ncbi:MAG TPA: amylo-alpha-1,6-glucosidase [Puia sp.]|nr:amylo-alpha-1,6-glucosidase [Puia sp.]
MLQKSRTLLQDYDQAVQYEWLDTNGLGGWSSSTIIGCHTRRYHGLLVAATMPPVERISLVSRLDETILAGEAMFELGTCDYGSVIHPNGYQYLYLFTRGLFPEWEYEAGGIRLKKTLAMLHGENTTLIKYQVLKAPGPFTLQLLPMLSGRDCHGLTRQNNEINGETEYAGGIFKTKLYEGTPAIFMQTPGAGFHPQPAWYLHFQYAGEKSRGLDFLEDLFTPGTFSIDLQEGDEWGILLSTENPSGRDSLQLLDLEAKRRQHLLHQPFNGFTLHLLTLAADQFIVQRGRDDRTIIAGYHWFTDWGRDTMISLPGLVLHAGRYNDARKILAAFASSVNMGMLPNRFADRTGEPLYNHADGTLWFFQAVYKFLQATSDRHFVLDEILPALKEIVDWHFKGTRYHIYVAEDGLLHAGEPGQQLTWMDAKIADWVVTPRMGKPVELQALWYNALKIFAELLALNGQTQDAATVEISAEKAKDSFAALFWNEQGNCLYDVIDEWGRPDDRVRPNQLFAISLPFPLLEGTRAKKVLDTVTLKLYTVVGLRSLAPDDAGYAPRYEGNQYQRDLAYHQGTVWSWLLGPYVDAIMRVEDAAWKAQEVITRFRHHLGEGGIGTVSEIFDAEPPHHPRGCIAQAWGVAEILRVIREYGLY